MEKTGLKIMAVLAVLAWIAHTTTYVDSDTQVRLKPTTYYSAGAKESDTLPLIIALTGDGAKQENFYTFIFKFLKAPARIIVLESPKSMWPRRSPDLENHTSAIATFATEMSEKYPTSGKPLLYGLSGGGMMSYASALTNCDAYSIIVPIAGSIKYIQNIGAITMTNNCRVMAFHGTNDGVVPFSQGRAAVEVLQGYSNNVSFFQFDGGHLGAFRDFRSMILEKVAEKL